MSLHPELIGAIPAETAREPIGNVPPAEAKACYYAQVTEPAVAA